jgi:hypothetical protein
MLVNVRNARVRALLEALIGASRRREGRADVTAAGLDDGARAARSSGAARAGDYRRGAPVDGGADGVACGFGGCAGGDARRSGGGSVGRFAYAAFAAESACAW